MAENWRPPDWKNPHTYGTDEEDYDIYVAFEAGADAMYPFALEKGKAEGRVELIAWLHEKCYKHDTGLLRLGCPECWKELRKGVGL